MPRTPSDLTDATGVRHRPVSATARIVCLVPSLTELLFALDLGDQIVGRTSYCIHPQDRLGAIPSVGGTKKVKHRFIRTLNATHAIINIDENPKSVAEQLAEYIPNIIVTHPNEPKDNLALYRLIGGIFQREAQAEALCERFEEAQIALQRETRDWPRQQVIYLIWRNPWMTVARNTYISNALALVHWDTLPVVTQPRYPKLEITEALLAEADLVLFSTEPYHFQTSDLEDFAHVRGCPHDKLALIDGEMISWFGNRAIQGLEYLGHFASSAKPTSS